MLAQRCWTPPFRDLGMPLLTPGSEPWMLPGHPQGIAFCTQFPMP